MSTPCDPDELRRRYRYRDLILRGKLRVPLEAARQLIGPDCAYHLYRTVASNESSEDENVETTPSSPAKRPPK